MEVFHALSPLSIFGIFILLSLDGICFLHFSLLSLDGIAGFPQTLGVDSRALPFKEVVFVITYAGG